MKTKLKITLAAPELAGPHLKHLPHNPLGMVNGEQHASQDYTQPPRGGTGEGTVDWR